MESALLVFVSLLDVHLYKNVILKWAHICNVNLEKKIHNQIPFYIFCDAGSGGWIVFKFTFYDENSGKLLPCLKIKKKIYNYCITFYGML